MSQKTELTANLLRQILETKHPQNFMLYADIFAIGCLLHVQGKQTAGRKLISQVINIIQEHGNKTYLNDLLTALEGNEFKYARDIHAHQEINELLRTEQLQLIGPEE